MQCPAPEPPSQPRWCPRWGRPALTPCHSHLQPLFPPTPSKPIILCTLQHQQLNSTTPRRLLFHVGGIPKRKLSQLKEEASILSRSAFDFKHYLCREKDGREDEMITTSTHTQFFFLQWRFEITNPSWLQHSLHLQQGPQQPALPPPSTTTAPTTSLFTHHTHFVLPPLIPVDSSSVNIKPLTDSSLQASPILSISPNPTCLIQHTARGRVILTLPSVSQHALDQFKEEAKVLIQSARKLVDFSTFLGSATDKQPLFSCTHRHFFSTSWSHKVIDVANLPASPSLASETTVIILVSSRLRSKSSSINSSKLQPSKQFVLNHHAHLHVPLKHSSRPDSASQKQTPTKAVHMSSSALPQTPAILSPPEPKLQPRSQLASAAVQTPNQWHPSIQKRKPVMCRTQLPIQTTSASYQSAKCLCTACSNGGVLLPRSTSSSPVSHTTPPRNPYHKRAPAPPTQSTLTPKIWPKLCFCKDMQFCRWCILSVPPMVEFVTPVYELQSDRYHKAHDDYVLCPCNRCAPKWLKIHKTVLWEHDFLYDTLCGLRPPPPGLLILDQTGRKDRLVAGSLNQW